MPTATPEPGLGPPQHQHVDIIVQAKRTTDSMGDGVAASTTETARYGTAHARPEEIAAART
ncbi:hypothetical protein X566_23135 [Afipia sp. P52-10]|uniref:hypothetical protein n=1 Tax=Afipia sp. P52-10 TaxID=1429916 RepID=UPI0003DF087F|nr:hypothetical protein [Afipia sp. P52-10]ETR75969.1 hypothetical protein X566_23135 [Afipia sp. P52-10]